MNPGILQFIEDIKKYLGDTKVIYEIGSRDGEDSKMFKEHFPSAQVIAFEPSSWNFKRCQKTIQDLDIEVHNLALSDYEGEADFYFSPDNIGASSLLKPDFVPWASNQELWLEKVKVKTLDNFCKENNIWPDVILEDVQGSEYNVLMGGREAFSKVKMAYVEVAEQVYYSGGQHKDVVLKEFDKLGFTTLRYEQDWSHEGNVTLVKKDLLNS